MCGTILWESKRTKNWSDGWLSKLREDQRTAKADISVIVSQTLPKGIEAFDVMDGVWVANPRAALPVATVLRHTLLQVSMARQASEGQQTKTEMVYDYLTGPRFRHRVEAIVEAFSSMHDDLDKERKVIMKQWAKREEQIDRVMGATVISRSPTYSFHNKPPMESLQAPLLNRSKPLKDEMNTLVNKGRFHQTNVFIFAKSCVFSQFRNLNSLKRFFDLIIISMAPIFLR